MRVFDHIQKVFVHIRILAEFRVKGTDKLVPLYGGNRFSVHNRKRGYLFSEVAYIRCANKGHGDLDAVEVLLGIKTAELPAVSVSDGGNIHGGEVHSVVVGNALCKKNQSRVSAEYGQTADNLFVDTDHCLAQIFGEFGSIFGSL